MLLVTTDLMPGKDINEALGLVKGEIVQSKHLGKRFYGWNEKYCWC